VQACANLNELYLTVGKNRLYAEQGRAGTNDLAERARELFERDAELSFYYNQTMADGKWNHMMDQTHIGYTGWQQPTRNTLPAVEEIAVSADAALGVAVEGSQSWWPGADSEAVLPELSPYQAEPTRFIEVFNRGAEPFDYQVEAAEPWLSVTPAAGSIEQEERLAVSIDWEQAPAGRQQSSVTVTGPNASSVVVQILIHRPAWLDEAAAEGFVQVDGDLAIEAEHYTRAVDAEGVWWQQIPGLGRTLSAMTPFPVTATRQTPGGDSPRLEYRMHLVETGEVKVRAHLSPTQNVFGTEGLEYAISIDDESPQLVNMHADSSREKWNQSVTDNINVMVTTHAVSQVGEHVLKFWMVDPGVVLQKLVVEAGAHRRSYLGPAESLSGP